MEIMELAPGITLRCFQDSRFKQGCLSFQLVRLLREKENAANALIPTVLLQGTRTYPDLRAITEYLDQLYGASIRELVRRVGDYQLVGLYCSFMDDRFAMEGDRVFAPLVDFLQQILLDSPLENGGFLEETVEREKKNLISVIESQSNNKMLYALHQLVKTVCREDSLGLPQLGEPEQVAAIDPVELYRYYRQALKTSPIEIFYVGRQTADQVAQMLMPLVAALEDRQPEPLPPQTGLHSCPGQDLVETMDVAQGKLCLGFTTPIQADQPEAAAMQVLNGVLGGGMTSKLFQNVREKLSLCYSIGSTYYSGKGVLAVYTGIDFDKEPQARQEILHQLALCQEGTITDQEIQAAKESLLSALRGTHDSPGTIEGYYLSSILSGLNRTPQSHSQALEAVTKEQVVAAARTLQLHSTYFLKGERK